MDRAVVECCLHDMENASMTAADNEPVIEHSPPITTWQSKILVDSELHQEPVLAVLIAMGHPVAATTKTSVSKRLFS